MYFSCTIPHQIAVWCLIWILHFRFLLIFTNMLQKLSVPIWHYDRSITGILTFKVDFPIYKKFKEATNTYVFKFRYTYMYKFQNYIHLHISIVSTYTCEYNNSVKSSLFVVSN